MDLEIDQLWQLYDALRARVSALEGANAAKAATAASAQAAAVSPSAPAPVLKPAAARAPSSSQRGASTWTLGGYVAANDVSGNTGTLELDGDLVVDGLFIVAGMPGGSAIPMGGSSGIIATPDEAVPM